MRLARLSERSGVSAATIKYYLREGLLPPGRQVNATTAEYESGPCHAPSLGGGADVGGGIRPVHHEVVTAADHRPTDPTPESRPGSRRLTWNA